ncbi:PHA-granule associated protein 4 [Cupriavidus taiwanensis]|uniref:PHA-granule associated protein 4 n=1 Tax=Cupriavidus taiwanensis TaxID=164546 RepID=A0A375JCV3_9BURK|nr:PHA-granule associated protein 4 [Cupriavidus taiwanensis]SPS02749.1 PHA-granule associated protein 4 [Cupriavidus taiwanensis]
MAIAVAATKGEALELLETEGVTVVDLDYESGWQDAIELGRLGEKLGICVQYRGHVSIAVRSPTALVAGLSRPKLTFRQRNLYCQFELSMLPTANLERLEGKAEKLGDYILAGHLMRDVDGVWTK